MKRLTIILALLCANFAFAQYQTDVFTATTNEVADGLNQTKPVTPWSLQHSGISLGGSGGNATNALANGPGGIRDGSLATNLQGSALVGPITNNTTGNAATATLATTAANLSGNIPSSQVTGSFASNQITSINGNQVQGNVAGAVNATNVTGSVNATQITGIVPSPSLNGQFILPAGIPNPLAWYSARTFANFPQGFVATNWPDISGNGYNLISSIPYAGRLNLQSAFGQPGITLRFNADVSLAYTNVGFFTANQGLSNGITIFVVYVNKTAPATADNLLSDDSGTLAFNYQAVAGTRGGAGAWTWYGNGNGYSFSIEQTYKQPQVEAYCFNGATPSSMAYVNGHGIYNTATAGDFGTPTALFGMTGNLNVGSLKGLTQAFIGDINEIIIFKGNLSPAQMNTMNQYLCGIYQHNANNFILDGDSVMQGQQALPGEDLTKLVSTNLPGVDIDCVALPGNTSGQQLVNQTNWLPTLKHSVNTVVAEMLGDSDNLNLTIAQAAVQLPITESNILSYCTNVHAAGAKIVGCTLPSISRETNGFRLPLNQFILTNGCFDSVADFAGLIPAIGTNGAYLNMTLFYTDGLHPLSPAYFMMSPILAAAYQAANAGTNFNGTFTGNGSGLTGVNAANVSGAFPSPVLTNTILAATITNLTVVSIAPNSSGTISINAGGGTVSAGTFSGGVFGGNGSSLTSLNASALASGNTSSSNNWTGRFIGDVSGATNDLPMANLGPNTPPGSNTVAAMIAAYGGSGGGTANAAVTNANLIFTNAAVSGSAVIQQSLSGSNAQWQVVANNATNTISINPTNGFQIMQNGGPVFTIGTNGTIGGNGGGLTGVPFGVCIYPSQCPFSQLSFQNGPNFFVWYGQPSTTISTEFRSRLPVSNLSGSSEIWTNISMSMAWSTALGVGTNLVLFAYTNGLGTGPILTMLGSANTGFFQTTNGGTFNFLVLSPTNTVTWCVSNTASQGTSAFYNGGITYQRIRYP